MGCSYVFEVVVIVFVLFLLIDGDDDDDDHDDDDDDDDHLLPQNEEEALNLLFEGETNRAIAMHSLNKASSRSHCIFTLHIESRYSQ